MIDDGFSEADLELLHALQIAPRVSWTDASVLLGRSPAKLAASWERLHAEGLAWITAHPQATPGSLALAFVEVDCVLAKRAQVVATLHQDPRVASVEESARGRDLVLTVMIQDLAGLTAFVLEDLPAIDGVASSRTSLATAVHQHGASWRLDSLDRRQRDGFEALARVGRPAPGHAVSPPPHAWPLIEALGIDGRASAADLARVTGRKPATVRRQLPRLLASQVLSIRCEVAQVASRWPISCSYFARIPASEQARTVAALSTLPELRLCVSTTGEANLMFNVWVRSLDRLLELESVLAEKLPWLTVLDSAINLRTSKRMGHLLDAEGRGRGMVPIDALSHL